MTRGFIERIKRLLVERKNWNIIFFADASISCYTLWDCYWIRLLTVTAPMLLVNWNKWIMNWIAIKLVALWSKANQCSCSDAFDFSAQCKLINSTRAVERCFLYSECCLLAPERFTWKQTSLFVLRCTDSKTIAIFLSLNFALHNLCLKWP